MSAVANTLGIRQLRGPKRRDEILDTHGHRAVARTVPTSSGSKTDQASTTRNATKMTSNTARLARSAD